LISAIKSLLGAEADEVNPPLIVRLLRRVLRAYAKHLNCRAATQPFHGCPEGAAAIGNVSPSGIVAPRSDGGNVGIQAPSAMRLILCTAIGTSIGAKNLIPEEVDYTKITIGVAVMNKV
jgi:hypothetical protein